MRGASASLIAGTASARPRCGTIREAATRSNLVASQVLRLHQHDAGGWLFWDYAGRLGELAVLAVMARPVAFRGEKLRMPWIQIPLWVLGIVLADHYLDWIRTTGNHLFPSTVLGHYPLSRGWLHWFEHGVRDWARHLHRGSRLSTMCSARVQALPRRRNAYGVGHVAAVRRAVWIVVASRAQPLSDRNRRRCLSRTASRPCCRWGHELRRVVHPAVPVDLQPEDERSGEDGGRQAFGRLGHTENRLRAMRGPQEPYSDVILKLAAHAGER